MLNGKLVLHDVRDVEAFCADLIDRNLSGHDREDLLAYLVETCWELSERFRPGAGTFAVWAGVILRRRVYDLERARFRTRWVFSDRVYERERPVFVPLDDRPDTADHTSIVDAGSCSGAALRGLLRERDSEPAWGDGSVGVGEASRAA